MRVLKWHILFPLEAQKIGIPLYNYVLQTQFALVINTLDYANASIKTLHVFYSITPLEAAKEERLDTHPT